MKKYLLLSICIPFSITHAMSPTVINQQTPDLVAWLTQKQSDKMSYCEFTDCTKQKTFNDTRRTFSELTFEKQWNILSYINDNNMVLTSASIQLPDAFNLILLYIVDDKKKMDKKTKPIIIEALNTMPRSQVLDVIAYIKKDEKENPIEWLTTGNRLKIYAESPKKLKECKRINQLFKKDTIPLLNTEQETLIRTLPNEAKNSLKGKKFRTSYTFNEKLISASKASIKTISSYGTPLALAASAGIIPLLLEKTINKNLYTHACFLKNAIINGFFATSGAILPMYLFHPKKHPQIYVILAEYGSLIGSVTASMYTGDKDSILVHPFSIFCAGVMRAITNDKQKNNWSSMRTLFVNSSTALGATLGIYISKFICNYHEQKNLDVTTYASIPLGQMIGFTLFGATYNALRNFITNEFHERLI